MSLNVVKKPHDMDIRVVLKAMNIKDFNNPRFPDIIDSQSHATKKALIEIDVFRKD